LISPDTTAKARTVPLPVLVKLKAKGLVYFVVVEPTAATDGTEPSIE
jgi:hypothetical protein